MPSLDDDLDKALLNALQTGELVQFEAGERPLPEDAVWKKPVPDTVKAPKKPRSTAKTKHSAEIDPAAG